MRAACLTTALFALTTLAAQAQDAPAPAALAPAAPAASASAPALGMPATTPAAPAALGRNVLRLDLAAVLFANLDNNFLGYRGARLPLLLSLEHQLKGRTSVVGEALLGGGSSYEPRWGLGVQGRYYLGHKAPLTGVYVAPTLMLRSVSTGYRYANPYNRINLYGGAGLLLGAQLPVGFQRRLLLDAAAGVMVREQLTNRQQMRRLEENGYGPQTSYNQHPVMPDVRLGLGWRF